MRTAWGYDVQNRPAPILTVENFHLLTNNAYSGNANAEAAITAASQAIRNYCGWHITPSLACTAKPAGGSGVLRLPASYVSEITSVTENGAELPASDYEWREDGLIRKRGHYKWTHRWGGISVEYTAGYSAVAVPDLIEAVVAIASGVMSASPGIVSESADGVAVSYSANAASIAAALTSQQKSALEPYKVVNSHAV